jgi:hypothetical protein
LFEVLFSPEDTAKEMPFPGKGKGGVPPHLKFGRFSGLMNRKEKKECEWKATSS